MIAEHFRFFRPRQQFVYVVDKDFCVSFTEPNSKLSFLNSPFALMLCTHMGRKNIVWEAICGANLSPAAEKNKTRPNFGAATIHTTSGWNSRCTARCSLFLNWKKVFVIAVVADVASLTSLFPLSQGCWKTSVIEVAPHRTGWARIESQNKDQQLNTIFWFEKAQSSRRGW